MRTMRPTTDTVRYLADAVLADRDDETAVLVLADALAEDTGDYSSAVEVARAVQASPANAFRPHGRFPNVNVRSICADLTREDGRGYRRFDLTHTADRTGWATDARYLVRLPDRMRAAVRRLAEDTGREPGRIAPHADILARVGQGLPAETAACRGFRPNGVRPKDTDCLWEDAAGRRAIANVKLVARVTRLWPKATAHIGTLSGGACLVFRAGGETVGVVMGMNATGEDMGRLTVLSV
jgi:hypothetical protein